MDKFTGSIKKKYQERRINFENQWPPCHSNKLVTLDIVERKKGQSSSQEGEHAPLAYEDLFMSENSKRPVRKILIEGDAGIGKTTLCISASEDWADGKLFQQFELLLLLPLRQKQISSAASLPNLLKLLHSSASIRDSVAHYLEEEEGEKVLIIADGWDELSESDRNEDSFLYKLMFEMLPLVSVVLTSRPSASAPLHRLPCIDRFIEVKGFSKRSMEKYIHSEFSSDKEQAGRLLEQLEDNPLVASLCSTPLNCAIVCHLWRTLEETLPTTMAELYTKIVLNIILRNIFKMHETILNLSNFDSLPNELQKSWWLLCEFAFRALEQDQTVFTQEELAEFFPEVLDSSTLCFGLMRSTESLFETGSGVSFQFHHLTFQEYLAALYLLKQPLDKIKHIMQSDTFEKNLLPFPTDFFPIRPIISAKSKKFSMVWQLFFGIYFSESLKSHLTIDDITKLLYQLINNSPHHHQLLCRCAFEARNAVVNDKVIQYLCSTRATFGSTGDFYFLSGVSIANFGHCFTRYDCAAMTYLISTMEECGAIMINFSNSGVGENQIQSLTDALASKHGKLQVVRMNLSGNNLTDKSVGDLFHRASVAFKLGGTIDLSSNMIGAESIESLSMALKARAHLSFSSSVFHNPQKDSDLLALEKAIQIFPFPLTLDLSHIPLKIAGLLALENALVSWSGSQSNFKLGNLYLIGSLTSDANVNAAWLTSFLEVCGPMFSSLDISENNLGVPGASALGRIFKEYGLGIQLSLGSQIMIRRQLFSGQMNLSETNLGDEGLSAFVECMDGPCNLNKLWLDNNNIHAIGLSCLTDAICLGMIENLCELYLKGNPLGFEGALAASRILSDTHCQLDTLILVGCQLTSFHSADSLNLDNSAVINQLCKMSLNHTVKWLGLSRNCFAGGRIHILAGFMYLCSNLECLGTNDCEITSDDLRQLLDLLTKLKSSSPHLCNKLNEWYLKSNELDASGLSALISCAPSLFPSLDCAKGLHLDNNPINHSLIKDLGARPPLPPVNEPQIIKDGKYIEWTYEGGHIRYPLPDSSSDTSKKLQTQWEVAVSSMYKSAMEILASSPLIHLKVVREDLKDMNGKLLTLDDLATVQAKVWEGRAKWYNIGLALKLTPGTLDAIQQTNHYVVNQCFTATLKEWLSKPELHPSWSGLATALKDSTVGLEDMAEQLPNIDIIDPGSS